MKSPQQVAKKWVTNLSRSGETIKDGVMSVTVSPMEQAASKQEEYLAGVQKAITTGKWVRGLRRKTKEDWQRAMIEKGVQRIPSGAQQAEGKVTEFLQELLPYTEQVKQMIRSMPKMTEADADARALKAIDMMRKFRRK